MRKGVRSALSAARSNSVGILISQESVAILVSWTALLQHLQYESGTRLGEIEESKILP